MHCSLQALYEAKHAARYSVNIEEDVLFSVQAAVLGVVDHPQSKFYGRDEIHNRWCLEKMMNQEGRIVGSGVRVVPQNTHQDVLHFSQHRERWSSRHTREDVLRPHQRDDGAHLVLAHVVAALQNKHTQH